MIYTMHIIGNTVINNTRQHAHLNRNDDKDNQDASHIALDSNYFRLENNSDIHIDSYLPIKHPFEQALYQTYLIDDMTSIDLPSLAVSVYLANHIMSQQHDVTLGIHVPSHLPNDLHGNIVPLTLTIDAKMYVNVLQQILIKVCCKIYAITVREVFAFIRDYFSLLSSNDVLL